MNKFSQTVGTISKRTGQIESMTMAEFLREYYADETTSPAGVMPKLHVCESIDYDLDDDLEEDLSMPSPIWCVWEWLPNGTKREIDAFETEDQADEFILERWFSDYQQNGGQPCYDSEQECFEALAASRDLPRSVNLHKTQEA